MAAKPVVQSFILCRDLIFNPQNLAAAIVHPTHEVFGAAFPLLTDVSVYSTWREVQGSYRLEEPLIDPEGEVVWSHVEPQPLVGNDRFVIHRIILHPLRVLIPKPGAYDFILMANGEEVFRTLLNAARQG